MCSNVADVPRQKKPYVPKGGWVGQRAGVEVMTMAKIHASAGT